MKLYVYCLVEGAVALEETRAGISGAPVRIVTAENLAVLVSDLEVESVPVTRENALTHAAVVRSVLNRTTPLPFRFGTIVNDQQLQSYLAAHRGALESKLVSLRGCVEMSVKIIRQISQKDQSETSAEADAEGQGAGTMFLAEKRQRILGDENLAAGAGKISKWLQKELSGLIRDEQVTLRPAEPLVLSAAHLIERDKITAYREAVAKARQNRPELHFLLSGPWPPYSFANIDLEFKTHFGVS